jgi:predicted acyl esterase
VLARVAANHIPAYMVGGEFDIFQNGEPLNYAELQNAWAHRGTSAPMRSGQRTTGRYQLIVGPWEHLNGSSVNVDPLELEWFDTWLKGERTGMARTPTPLHYYDLGSGAFTETSRYPFTGASPTRLYFGPGGTLTSSAPSAGSGTSSSPIPGLPLPWLPASQSDTLVWSPSGVPCGRSIDQWSMGGLSVPAGSSGFLAPCATDDRLTQTGPWATSYTSAPLAHAQTLAGPVTATVYASATTTQTQLVSELEEVTPDGTSYPLTEGALLGSLRAVNPKRSWSSGGMTVLPYHPYTQASAKPVTPGQMTRYQIQIFPTLATIASGDRLRLTLSTADAPHLTPLPPQLSNLAGGVYTIGRSATAPSSLTFETVG